MLLLLPELLVNGALVFEVEYLLVERFVFVGDEFELGLKLVEEFGAIG
jgi:hypothetical protein